MNAYEINQLFFIGLQFKAWLHLNKHLCYSQRSAPCNSGLLFPLEFVGYW